MLIVNRKYFSPIEMASSYTLPAESLLFVNQQEASSKKLAAKIVRYSISLAMVLFFSINTVAQIIGQFDTVRTAELDTLPAFKGKKVVTIESYAKRFDPRQALLYSAVFPGAGAELQVSNLALRRRNAMPVTANPATSIAHMFGSGTPMLVIVMVPDRIGSSDCSVIGSKKGLLIGSPLAKPWLAKLHKSVIRRGSA